MSHQDRREPLPKGYQFGDARPQCEHDYRARYRGFLPGYMAICEKCGHDAGVVELRGLMVLEGTGQWTEGQRLG